MSIPPTATILRQDRDIFETFSNTHNTIYNSIIYTLKANSHIHFKHSSLSMYSAPLRYSRCRKKVFYSLKYITCALHNWYKTKIGTTMSAYFTGSEEET